MALTLRWNPAMCIEGNFNARLGEAEKSESYSSRDAPVCVLFPQAVRDLSLLVQFPHHEFAHHEFAHHEESNESEIASRRAPVNEDEAIRRHVARHALHRFARAQLGTKSGPSLQSEAAQGTVFPPDVRAGPRYRLPT